MNLISKIKNGDKIALTKGITLLESSLENDRKTANNLIEKCLTIKNKTIRIGITGSPGVGKSTFIEAFGNLLINNGLKVAVLAIDPASTTSKGSILGDKSRMIKLSSNKNSFIRPSSNQGELGGINIKTRESIILCEAAGYDIILIETVGVGQSEINVSNITDFLLLLILPESGDELQGIKRGINEIANAVIINKSDGDNINKAKKTYLHYKNALTLASIQDNIWKVKIGECSALKNTGILEVWDIIQEYTKTSKEHNHFYKKRRKQDVFWLSEEIKREHGYKKYKALQKEGIIEKYNKQILNKKSNIYDILKLI